MSKLFDLLSLKRLKTKGEINENSTFVAIGFGRSSRYWLDGIRLLVGIARAGPLALEELTSGVLPVPVARRRSCRKHDARFFFLPGYERAIRRPFV